MKLLHRMSVADIADVFYCNQGTARKIKGIAKAVYEGDGGIYDALDALDYNLRRRGAVHRGRYSYIDHGYLDEEPTIIADHEFESRGVLGSRHGALFVGYVGEISGWISCDKGKSCRVKQIAQGVEVDAVVV